MIHFLFEHFEYMYFVIRPVSILVLYPYTTAVLLCCYHLLPSSSLLFACLTEIVAVKEMEKKINVPTDSKYGNIIVSTRTTNIIELL